MWVDCIHGNDNCRAQLNRDSYDYRHRLDKEELSVQKVSKSKISLAAQIYKKYI